MYKNGLEPLFTNALFHTGEMTWSYLQSNFYHWTKRVGQRVYRIVQVDVRKQQSYTHLT